jgi:Bacterial capsule synthesis protein PGA_cap
MKRVSMRGIVAIGLGLLVVAPMLADNSFRIALTGDSLITMKLSVHTDPPFLKMIDLIRGADAAFTNLEMLLHDYEPYPSTESGGTYMRADPSMAKELVWAGFDMVARANNFIFESRSGTRSPGRSADGRCWRTLN